jgi:hypothetical protein
MDEIPKPRELLAIRGATEDLFILLRQWFAVPTAVTLDLRAVDSAVAELGEPRLVMAMAMRKLQALHLLTTPGVVTTTDVVLTVIQDLERALLQAPAMHLRDAAAATDWDAALAALDDDDDDDDDDREEADAAEAQADDGGENDEITLFRTHHAALHEAARAVLHVSDGRIRRLV